MSNQKVVDHLFRHHYGKMVSVLTRIFGLPHLETIEDAVQDTFAKAVQTWRQQIPENPEAWLTKAAKNRVIDLFRKIQADKKRVTNLESGPAAIAINELFLDTEVEDSQLRMIFTACHPALNPRDQISFALKTVAGFSQREIAAALLLKEETIKKRLSRARKSIKDNDLDFNIPQGTDLPDRLDRVMEVLYLIFNEGFHSSKAEIVVRKELCGEAMRLCKLLLKNNYTKDGKAYALFALMCFHAARLDTKSNEANELIDLKNQDRSKWHAPLILMGNSAMDKAVANGIYSSYHYEAAIACEHVIARDFAATDWQKILTWYECLAALQPSVFTSLNIAMVYIQLQEFTKASDLLVEIDPLALEQRSYLYYGAWAEFYIQTDEPAKAQKSLDAAIAHVNNIAEKDYLKKKKATL
ncbi:MAG: sigma-70 family RNA polymerase sigma factor [Bacteroidota bacterium]